MKTTPTFANKNPPMPKNTTYQLKVTLSGANPPIWRRLLVDRTATFQDLHQIIQLAMGWHTTHLHLFQASDGTLIGDPEEDDDGMMNYVDEAFLPIDAVLKREKQRLRYEYDFGDSWEHQVLLEKILPGDQHQTLPTCIKAARQCPPEDVGGLHGFYDFLHVMSDMAHPEHIAVREWIGGDLFDPEFVDLQQINQDLANREQIFGPPGLASGADLDGLDAVQLEALLQNPLNCPEVFRQEPDRPAAEKEVQAAPIIRGLMALVHELQGQGVRVTPKSNLPLKVVNAILEHAGEDFQPYFIRKGMARVRSEDDVLPVQLVRLLADIAGFTQQQKGRLILKKQTDIRAQKGDWLGLYADLFKVVMSEFNWGWMDRHPGLEDIQAVGPYALWLLANDGSEWRPLSFYQEKMLNAFPGLLDRVAPLSFSSAENQFRWVLKSRMVRIYEFLGLLTLDPRDPGPFDETEQQVIRTRLFESLFIK